MSWEETILSDEEIDRIRYQYNEIYKGGVFEHTMKLTHCQEVAKAQAEKSYKAGKEDCPRVHLSPRWKEESYTEGYKQSRRDVIEWLGRYIEPLDDRPIYILRSRDWQVLLKELKG